MRTTWDCIVIGVGGIGSAATYWLSKLLGKDVLALEQFRLGHEHGASQDHSRIIRLSYHTPEYTALTPATYDAWAEVEAESGQQLVFRTGGLDIAPASQEAVLASYASSMQAAGIPFEALSAREAMERWPQWQLQTDDRVLFQSESGLVDPRRAIQTQVALARAHGATVLDETKVLDIQPHANGGADVITTRGTFHAGNVVVCADAWTNQVLASTGTQFPLTVTQEQVTYWGTPNLRDYTLDRFPIWIFHGGAQGYFYGFPVYGEVATKAGEDVGGEVVTPETRTYEPNPKTKAKLEAFMAQRCPGALGPELYTRTCLYTLTPDRDFIIDRLPEFPQVSVALGAAHAFKFSSLIGQILADLATEGDTRQPIAPFTLQRPALTDPTFTPTFQLVP